jgi:hypothetical protein
MRRIGLEQGTPAVRTGRSEGETGEGVNTEREKDGKEASIQQRHGKGN